MILPERKKKGGRLNEVQFTYGAYAVGYRRS